MSELTHEQLLEVLITLPDDYVPWGKREHDVDSKPAPDCSAGCKWFHPLAGQRGMDWGVCGNPLSHRYGFLTFEHQGCATFEAEEEA